MILLDTDHASALKYKSSERAQRLTRKLGDAVTRGETIATSIVSVEEQLRGWLASLAKERSAERQVGPYRELGELFIFYSAFNIVLFEARAAKQYEAYNSINISSRDRKIASIAQVNSALLLTANKQHFARIPSLRFENWMDAG